MRRVFGNQTVFVEASQIAKTLAVAPGSLRFVDARFAFNDPEYLAKEHVKLRPAAPGCFTGRAGLERDLSSAAPDGAVGAGRHPLPDVACFIQFCQRELQIGNGDDAAVPTVCFDDKGGALAASRLWWMLDNLGHESYVLSGGIQAYQAAGLPTACGDYAAVGETSASPPTNSRCWPHRRSWSNLASLADVHSASSATAACGRREGGDTTTCSTSSMLVDCRPAPRFESWVAPATPMDKRAGHVPGAINVPFPSNLTADMSKLQHNGDAERLRRNFAPILPTPQGGGQVAPSAKKNRPESNANTPPAATTITTTPPVPAPIFMCGSGVTACFNLAVARHVGVIDELGCEPRLFPGSWSAYEDACRDKLVQLDKTAHGVAVLEVLKWPCVLSSPSGKPTPTSTIVIRDVTAAAAAVTESDTATEQQASSADMSTDVVATLKRVMPVGMTVSAETACGVRFTAIAE